MTTVDNRLTQVAFVQRYRTIHWLSVALTTTRGAVVNEAFVGRRQAHVYYDERHGIYVTAP